jgi:hypothetical protein
MILIVPAVVGGGVSALYVAIFRRYAAASARLRDGERPAVAQVVAAQASFFKTTHIVVIILLALGLAGLMVRSFLDIFKAP